MTSHETHQPGSTAEPRGRTVKASAAPAEPQPKSTAHEQAARSVMHPDYHDPDWRYYHGAIAVAS